MSRTVGIVDLGSNTVRLEVHALTAGGGHRLVAERRATLRLAQAGGHLGADALARTAAALVRFRRVCEDYEAAEIVAVATAAVRAADNGPEFVNSLARATGIHCRILDGDAEAEMGFLGALSALDAESGVLVDIGGASTEATAFAGRRMGPHTSLPVGAVNTTAAWLPDDPPAAAQLDRLHQHLADLLQQYPWLGEGAPATIVGVGGTFRAIAKMSQRRSGVRRLLHGTEVDARLPAQLLGELARLPAARRGAYPGLPRHRADIIAGGLLIVNAVTERVGARRIVVSGRGLRDGLLLAHLRPAPVTEVVPPALEESLRVCRALFQVEGGRARRVRALALDLFDALAPIFGLGKRERVALAVGAELRGAGTVVDYYDRARHAFYLVRNAPLHGLSARQRDLAAAVAAFDDYAGHHTRWQGAGRPGDLTRAARLGLMAALGDVLADAAPGARPAVLCTPGLVRVTLAGSEVCAAEALAEWGDDFRRLFGRPLAIGSE